MKKFFLFGSCLVLSLLAGNAKAANAYWAQSLGSATPSGSWESAVWSTALAGTSPTTFVEGSFPEFSAGTSATGAYTITANANHTVAGIYAKNGTVTINGTGQLTIAAGIQGFLAPTATGMLIYNTLTGPGGVESDSGSGLQLLASNSYTGGTFLDAGYLVYYNNNNAFGTGPIFVGSGPGFQAILPATGSPASLTLPNLFSNSIANSGINFASGATLVTLTGGWDVVVPTYIRNNGTGTALTISGPIFDAGGIITSGNNGGSIVLAGTNTYTGVTVVSNATLALAATGSINSSANLAILSSGLFDVSAVDPYMLSSHTMLNATGTGTGSLTTAATLNDSATGADVNLGTNQINLSFKPTAFIGDTTHPSLLVTVPNGGSLSLSNNQIVVTNSAATALGAGTYYLIQVGDGSGSTGTINGTPSPVVIVEGTGLAAGNSATASVLNNAVVVLTVAAAANTTTTTLSALGSITYGSGSPVTATATVSPVPNSGEVLFFVNGAPVGSPVAVDTGTGLASYTYTPAANAPAGNYSITANYSGSSDGTFSDSTAAAVTLVISTVGLTVTANAQTVTYGTAATTGTGKTTFTSSGLQNGETIGSVTLTAGGTGYISTNTPVGSNYTITPSAATGGTFTAANYTITYSVGNLTVTAKALTITASAESMIYGQTYTGFGTLKTTNFTGSGFVNGQAAGSMTVTLTCPNGTATTPAGAYAGSIVTGAAAELSGKTNFNPGNYTITYVNGNFTVNKAAATVTATPQTIVYGTAVVTNGSANFTTSTLSNSETIGSVTLSLSGATAGTNVITPGAATGGSGTEANYNITYITNSLVVTPLPVVLTGTRAYDGTGTATNLILTVSNVVGGDDVNVSTVPGFAVLAGANVGPENITDFSGLILGGVTSTNYTLAGASGSVTITNPYNPFMITSSHLDATGTNFVVAWDSVPGVIYTIMTNSDLTTTNWAAAGGSVTATNSSTTSSFPVAPDGSTQMFVRIKQQ